MGRILPRILDTKVKNILSWERALAKAVASTILEFKPPSVWEIMIPILFLFNFFQYKRARETFSLNFLFTKKMALEAAFGMIDQGKGKEQAKAEVKEKTDKILAAEAKGIYSSKIRQKQMKEIDLLIDYYVRLLEADAKDFASMVKKSYGTRENYGCFLEQLSEVEKEVNRAAAQTVRTHSAAEIVSKMEAAVKAFRKAEVERIFPIDG